MSQRWRQPKQTAACRVPTWLPSCALHVAPARSPQDAKKDMLKVNSLGCLVCAWKLQSWHSMGRAQAVRAEGMPAQLPSRACKCTSGRSASLLLRLLRHGIY